MTEKTIEILKHIPSSVVDSRCIPKRTYHFEMTIRECDGKHMMGYLSHEWREAPVYVEGNSYEECAVKFMDRISKADCKEFYKQLKWEKRQSKKPRYIQLIGYAMVSAIAPQWNVRGKMYWIASALQNSWARRQSMNTIVQGKMYIHYKLKRLCQNYF